MKREHEEVDYWFLAYNCPVNDDGHFSITDVRSLETYLRKIVITFKCHSCSELHTITMRTKKGRGR